MLGVRNVKMREASLFLGEGVWGKGEIMGVEIDLGFWEFRIFFFKKGIVFFYL